MYDNSCVAYVLRRLILDTPRKVFLILDDLRVHHGKLVQKWLAERKDQIEVFFLSPRALAESCILETVAWVKCPFSVFCICFCFTIQVNYKQ